ncbi:glycosyltransferase family 2 protein [Filomicrobium insigne]|nr:glycosyltransferase family A protein [Filomicrobium insigne]MCV0371366.1 glycosyltransferase family 2 protein [Filomicrobium sp.]
MSSHNSREGTMKISVVIPVSQRQKSAERALRSALLQDGPVHEVLVVDDASSPPFRLPDELKNDNRIRIIRNEVNVGAGASREAGCHHAKGDWIAFLDSDDYWLPGKLAAQAILAQRDFTENPGALVCYSSGYQTIRRRTGKQRGLVPAESSHAEDFASACWFMPGSTVLISKRALKKTGPFDLSLRRLEDLDWYMRFGLAGGRLRVAAIKGAVIEIGERPTPLQIHEACGLIEQKWLNPNADIPLPAKMRTALRAYLDIERAAAHHHAGRVMGTIWFLGRSFLRRPRRCVHLKKWWHPLDEKLEPP